MEFRASALVVDDDPINRMLLSNSLEQQGHRVMMAENGLEALAALQAQPFDVVLLDVLMPGLDGSEVLARLKQDPGLRHVPVVMVSALEDIQCVVRCIEMGAEPQNPRWRTVLAESEGIHQLYRSWSEDPPPPTTDR